MAVSLGPGKLGKIVIRHSRRQGNMRSLRKQTSIITVAFGCWCFQMILRQAVVKGCVTTDVQCSDICEYSSWALHAYCGERGLTSIPRECCGVKTLDVRLNAIRDLTSGALSNFTNLKYVYLTGNNMSQIGNGAFFGCKRLEFVSMGENDFRELTGAMIEGMENVRYMVLSRGRLEAIGPDAFSETPMLQTLDLRANQFLSPPCDALPSHNVLSGLHLSNNLISLLPKGCFLNYGKLQRLRLDNNPIGNIVNETAFEGLELLDELHLKNISIREIPVAVFQYVNTLRTLILSLNKINRLDEHTFLYLPELRVVDLDNNVISVVHSRAFDGLEFLEILVLSNNQITMLGHGALFPFEGTLRELHLHGNRLTEIQNFSTSISSRLEQLLVADNPLVCSCRLLPLRLWLESNPGVAKSAEGNASCESSRTATVLTTVTDSWEITPCLTLTTIHPIQEKVILNPSASPTTSDQNPRNNPRLTITVIFAMIGISAAIIITICLIIIIRKYRLTQSRKDREKYYTYSQKHSTPETTDSGLVLGSADGLRAVCSQTGHSSDRKPSHVNIKVRYADDVLENDCDIAVEVSGDDKVGSVESSLETTPLRGDASDEGFK